MLHFRGEVSHFLKTKYIYKKKHDEGFALLVAPIVALNFCRFVHEDF